MNSDDVQDITLAGAKPGKQLHICACFHRQRLEGAGLDTAKLEQRKQLETCVWRQPISAVTAVLS